MKTVHNPTEVDIKAFNPSLGIKYDGLPAKATLQFPDEVADFMIETWGFLQILNSEETKPTGFKCKFCGKEYTHHLPLASHLRSHKGEEPKVEIVDEIPVASAKKMASPIGLPEQPEIPEGASTDGDGVAWYGEGMTETHGDFQAVRPTGQGHFGGEGLLDG